MFIQIRQHKIIVASVLLTFGFFILGFNSISITRQFVCVLSLFVLSLIMTPNRFYFVRLPTDSSQAMLFQIQVEFSHSHLCHIATLNEGNPLKVLVRPFLPLPSSILNFSCSNISSSVNIFQLINICYDILLFKSVFRTEDLDGILIVNPGGVLKYNLGGYVPPGSAK